MTHFSSSKLWHLDDSGYLQCNGAELFIDHKTTQSTKFNAIWKETRFGLSVNNPSAQFYKIKIIHAGAGVWVGLCPESKFGAGWKCKSLSFGGNLSDGGGLKRKGFGNVPVIGDEVGIRAEILTNVNNKSNTSTLVIHYSLNGAGLGQAFEVSLLETETLEFFPLVSFNGGKAKVSISREEAPPIADFQLLPEQPRTSIGGQWSISSGDLLLPDEDLSPMIIHIFIDTSKMLISAKVANNFSTHLSNDFKTTGNVAMTMMMPPGHLGRLEAAVKSMMENIQNITLMSELESGKLRIDYNQGKSILAKPYQTRCKPVTREEISWMNS